MELCAGGDTAGSDGFVLQYCREHVSSISRVFSCNEKLLKAFFVSATVRSEDQLIERIELCRWLVANFIFHNEKSAAVHRDLAITLASWIRGYALLNPEEYFMETLQVECMPNGARIDLLDDEPPVHNISFINWLTVLVSASDPDHMKPSQCYKILTRISAISNHFHICRQSVRLIPWLAKV